MIIKSMALVQHALQATQINLFGVLRKVCMELLADFTKSEILMFCRATLDAAILAIALPDVRRLVIRIGAPPLAKGLDDERCASKPIIFDLD